MKRSFSSKYEEPSKKFRGAVFTKREMNNEWNVHFLQNTRSLRKNFEIGVVFTKREMNNERDVHFLKMLYAFTKYPYINFFIYYFSFLIIIIIRPDLIIINKKKRTCKIVDFAVPADHRIKLKECEKKDKYLDLARELKKLWNMQVTIIPIVIGSFGTVTKGLLKGLEDLEVGGRMETIQTTALLRTAKILRRVLETWGDLPSLRLQWKTIG